MTLFSLSEQLDNGPRFRKRVQVWVVISDFDRLVDFIVRQVAIPTKYLNLEAYVDDLVI